MVKVRRSSLGCPGPGLSICLIAIVATVGCDRGPQLAPVSGTVTLDGKPLEFGTVMFQPASGQPARAKIQNDGNFEMSTFRQGDGATVGFNKVRITCYESQRSDVDRAAGEQSLGKLLIPRKYTLFDKSGLTVEVQPKANEPVEFALKSD